MTFTITYSIAIVISCAALAILAKVAPEGYEDENGFHYGRRP